MGQSWHGTTHLTAPLVVVCPHPKKEGGGKLFCPGSGGGPLHPPLFPWLLGPARVPPGPDPGARLHRALALEQSSDWEASKAAETTQCSERLVLQIEAFPQ